MSVKVVDIAKFRRPKGRQISESDVVHRSNPVQRDLENDNDEFA
jgi:hypothetical protein